MVKFLLSSYFAYRKAKAEKYLTSCAKLIAPAIDPSFASGFDW